MGRPRSDAARRKVLDAATEVVLERGVRGFSIDEIARRSGVAKTTIYRHFPDRDELLVRSVDATVIYPEPPDTGTLRGDLHAFLRLVHPNFADRRANAAHLELFAALAREPELWDAVRRSEDSGRSPLAALHHRWRAHRQIRDDLTVGDVFEIVDGPFVTRSLLDPEGLDSLDDEGYDRLVERMLLQLLPAGATGDEPVGPSGPDG